MSKVYKNFNISFTLEELRLLKDYTRKWQSISIPRRLHELLMKDVRSGGPFAEDEIPGLE